MNLRHVFHALVEIDDAIRQVEEIHRRQPVGELLLRAEMTLQVENNPREMCPTLETIGAVAVVAGTAPPDRFEIRIVDAEVCVVRPAILQPLLIFGVVDSQRAARFVSPLVPVEVARRHDLCDVRAQKNSIGIVLNHPVNLVTHRAESSAVIERASCLRNVTVEIEAHIVPVRHALFDDTLNFMNIARCRGVIPRDARIVLVVLQATRKDVQLTVAAQVRVRLVVAPDGDGDGQVLKPFVGYFAEAVGDDDQPEIVVDFLEAVEHQARLASHNRHVIRAARFLPFDEGVED